MSLFPEILRVLAAFGAVLLIMSCSPVEDDSISSDGEFQADGDAEADLEAEPEPDFEYNRDVDFEADIPDFEPPENPACHYPVGSEKCRYCGMLCEDLFDCPNGYSCIFGECTRSCLPDTSSVTHNDCGDGWHCRAISFLGSDVSGGAEVCVRGSGDECVNDASCTEGESCFAYWPKRFWKEFQMFCAPDMPCGKDTGESCDSDLECKSRYCIPLPESEGRVCSMVCDPAGDDCLGGKVCRYFQVNPAEFPIGAYCERCHEFYTPLCLSPNQGISPTVESMGYQVCKSDDDCNLGEDVSGELCGGPVMKRGFDEVEFVCQEEIEGGLEYGEDCSFDPEDGLECANGFCLPSVHRCSIPCDQVNTNRYRLGSDDCPNEEDICHRIELGENPYSPQETLETDICADASEVASLGPCNLNGDCGEGEVCAGFMEIPLDLRRAGARSDGDIETEEEASEEPVSDGDTDAALESEAEETVADGDTESDFNVEIDTVGELEIESDTVSDGDTAAESELELESDAVADGDTEAEPEPEIETEPMQLAAYCIPKRGGAGLGERCYGNLYSSTTCITGFCEKLNCTTLCVEDADCEAEGLVGWTCAEKEVDPGDTMWPWRDQGYTIKLCKPPDQPERWSDK